MCCVRCHWRVDGRSRQQETLPSNVTQCHLDPRREQHSGCSSTNTQQDVASWSYIGRPTVHGYCLHERNWVGRGHCPSRCSSQTSLALGPAVCSQFTSLPYTPFLWRLYLRRSWNIWLLGGSIIQCYGQYAQRKILALLMR